MSWCRWGKWQQGGRGGQGAGGRAADLCRASGELMQVGQVVRRYGYHCIRGQVGGPAPGLSASLPLCLSDSLTLCLLPPVYSHVPLPLPPTCCLSLYVPCVHACKWLCLHTQGCMCACVHMFVCMRACVRACVCMSWFVLTTCTACTAGPPPGVLPPSQPSRLAHIHPR